MSFSGSTASDSHQVVERRQAPGMHLNLVRRANLCEVHLTVLPLAGEPLSGVLGRLHAVLEQHAASLVRLHVYGSTKAYDGVLGMLSALFGEVNWPVLWVEGADCAGGPIAGLYARAVAGKTIEPLRIEDRVVGSLYEDSSARHCFIGGLGPQDCGAARPTQVEQTYDRLETVLGMAGMDLSHVIRTWFYIDNILGWYDDFNCVRTTVFERHGIFDKLVPASTGIGATNPAGGAVVIGARAMQSLTPEAQVLPVTSPLQCPAPAYGSSFSRAVEMRMPGLRHLLISGTASIEPEGHTVHVGDFVGQVDLTMKVVQAILESRGMSYADVTRGTAYLRRAEDLRLYQSWAAEQGLAHLPVIHTRADICRDDLLFEIEFDAMMPGSGPSPAAAPSLESSL